jgi:hypothetical protein
MAWKDVHPSCARIGNALMKKAELPGALEQREQAIRIERD